MKKFFETELAQTAFERWEQENRDELTREYANHWERNDYSDFCRLVYTGRLKQLTTTK